MSSRPRSAVVLIGALMLAGCADGAKVSRGVTDETRAKVAKIAVIAPLDAGLVQFGRGIRSSVQLAVDQANAAQSLPDGWRLEVLALDDSSNPETGEAAAKRAAADPTVIGVVGTYNSGVAARVAPVLEAAGIAMVSPGNTDPALTLGPDLAVPSRPWPTYFRMVTSDNIQGPFLARYAFDDLGARRVSVVTETKPVSRGMADAYIAGVEPASEGDLASSIGSPAASIPSARRFLDAYSDAGYADPPSDFGVYAYDAANVIIAAAKAALDQTDRVTADALGAIVAGIQATEAAGASGPLAFDEFGDTRSKALTVYRVVGGSWTAVKAETLH